MASNFFLYARKSTDTEEKQVLSIDAQLAELRTFAAREHLAVTAEYAEAMTAKVPGRPKFGELLDRIEKGEAQGILAWHPDRLARNSVDGGRIIYLLDTGRLKFLKFPSFWFENTPQGKFMLNLAFGQSKLYSDNLSENVKRAVREKLRRGEWPGWAPTGYLNDRSLRKVVPDPIKGPLVRDLFEAYATGRYTVAQLGKLAFQWGLSTRRGKPLARATMDTLLRNPFYYGVMRVNGERHLGIHAPIVRKEVFDQVQANLTNRGRPRTHEKTAFPFVGLAVCATCGCSVTAERQKGHNYYHCTKKRGSCDEPYIREESLADQIRSAICDVALPDESYRAMTAHLASERKAPSVADREAQLKDSLAHVQAKLDRLLDSHLEGLLDKQEYVAKKAEVLDQRVELQEEIAKLAHTATDSLEPMAAFLKSANQAGQIAAVGDLETQRAFLKKAGSNLRLSRKTLCVSWELPWAILARAADKKIWLPGTDLNCRPAG